MAAKDGADDVLDGIEDAIHAMHIPVPEVRRGSVEVEGAGSPTAPPTAVRLLQSCLCDELDFVSPEEAGRRSLKMGAVHMTTPGGRPIPGTLTATSYALRFAPDAGAGSKLLSQVPHAWWTLPLLLIRRIAPSRPTPGRHPSLTLHCKDVRAPRLLFARQVDADQVTKLLRALVFPGDAQHVFAFEAVPRARVQSAQPGWFDVFMPDEEFRRQGALTARNPMTGQQAWRTSNINDQYRFAPTYPHQLVVPAGVTDAALAPLMRFRSKGRIPALTWRHRVNGTAMLRSSQPRIGMTNASCAEDVALLAALKATSDAYLQATHQARFVGQATSPAAATPPPAAPVAPSPSLADARRASVRPGGGGGVDPLNPFNAPVPAGGQGGAAQAPPVPLAGAGGAGSLPPTPTLLIADCRPGANALAQKAGGWGYEAYPNCETVFLGIHNIHKVRGAYQAMEALARKPYEGVGGAVDLGWGEAVERTQWPSMCRCVLGGALRVAHAMEVDHRSVLVHCSDGWDRTAQVCGLVQVLLDPHFRTITGLCTLITKDWCVFGHKFHHRLGTGNPKGDDDGEASPVFLQFLDCLWQLVVQFPAAFEYTPRLLRALGHHAYSCRFGTFLFNCEKERWDAKVQQRTLSLWAWVEEQAAGERRCMGPPSTGEGGVPPTPRIQDVLGFLNPLYDSRSAQCILLPPPSVVLRAYRTWDDWWFTWTPVPVWTGDTAPGVGPPGDTRWGTWWDAAPPSPAGEAAEEGGEGGSAPPGTYMPVQDSPYRASASQASRPPVQSVCRWLRERWEGDGLGHVAGAEDGAMARITSLREAAGLAPAPATPSPSPEVALTPPAGQAVEEESTPAGPALHTGPGVDPFTGQALGSPEAVVAVTTFDEGSAAEESET